MPQQILPTVENNFTKGLVTEFTGLNFPENAATDADNCEFTLVGNVLRRQGIDFEEHPALWTIGRDGGAVNTYKWDNAGGDGQTQVLAIQINGALNFWKSSDATPASPLSTHILSSIIDLAVYTALGGTFDKTLECQFASGNGYLFVYHPSCDPIYCSYNAGVITANRITVKIRDFAGVNEFGVPVDTRPTALTIQHNYNLINQGWASGNPWSTISFSPTVVGLGSKTFAVLAGLTVTLGDQVTILNNHPNGGLPVIGPMMSGNVTAYAGTSMTINVTSGSTGWFGIAGSDWLIVPRNTAYISTWASAVGNYPSNADQWWTFKNSSDVFDPATTVSNNSLSSGPAPRGHIILDAFNQQRDVLSGIAVTDVITNVRPRTGTWFQGRVWYTGVDGQQAATGDAQFTTWTENIYFSQIVTTPDQFGLCYQQNDPTSETLFDLLPTDGGVIQIQGCGAIYKLFPIQNGMLVFAANGIHFITGSRGIGFTANDYTVTQISDVRSMSSTSFVNVQGLPYFWNEEGIYAVETTQGGGLAVNPITVGTILTFFDDIPAASKKYVRGAYHPIDYRIQWIYRDTEETSVTDRYEFNKILNYNTYNKAFYPYSVSAPTVTINGINYISSPGGTNASLPAFKYLTTRLSPAGLTWSDEHDENYVDFSFDGGGTNYTSYFVTGYRLHGQAQKRIQVPYIVTYSRGGDTPTAFKLQGIWDYATTGNSGRWSTAQLIQNWDPNFSVIPRRHRLRGQGLVLQIKVTSVDGQLFDLMGWSTMEAVNASV